MPTVVTVRRLKKHADPFETQLDPLDGRITFEVDINILDHWEEMRATPPPRHTC